MERLEYRYRTRWWAIIVMLILFGVCVGLGIHNAGKGRGLVFHNVLHLGPGGARIFWLSIAGFGALCLLFTIGVLYARIAFEQRIVVDNDGIELPAGIFTSKHQRIAFADITGMRSMVMNNSHFTHISRRNGRKVSIAAVKLPNHAAYQAVIGRIADATASARSAPARP